jgi:hypothetical protein
MRSSSQFIAVKPMFLRLYVVRCSKHLYCRFQTSYCSGSTSLIINWLPTTIVAFNITSPSPLPFVITSQPNSNHRPPRSLFSYTSYSAAFIPHCTMKWRRPWRSLKWMAETRHQLEDPIGFPDMKAKPNTNTLKLSGLPPELIILIASMLSIQSAACLSLCNRAMSQILGPNIWRCLKLQTSKIRASFLFDLSKDLPQYFVCYACIKLHASSGVQWPRTAPRTLPRCPREGHALLHCPQSVLCVRFLYIQLAMNRHYRGPSYGFPLEAFQSTEIIESDVDRNVVLLSVDTQIVFDELLMRSQQWVLIPRDRRHELVDDRSFSYICPHIWVLGRPGNNLPTLIQSRLDLFEQKGRCYTSTMRCLKCPVDFVMDIVDLGERGVAACLTRWINLGAGLDPADPKWQSHLGKLLPRGVIYRPHHLGNIRWSFESQTAISFEDFSAKNVYNLLSRRERKRITRRSDGFIWKLVCHDPHRWYLENAESLGWFLARMPQFLLNTILPVKQDPEDDKL